MSLKWEIIRDCLGTDKKLARDIAIETGTPLYIIKGCLALFKKKGVFALEGGRLWSFVKEPEGRPQSEFFYTKKRKMVTEYVFERIKLILNTIKNSDTCLSRMEIKEKCNIYCDIKFEIGILEKNGLILSKTRNYHEKEYCVAKEYALMKIVVKNVERELSNE